MNRFNLLNIILLNLLLSMISCNYKTKGKEIPIITSEYVESINIQDKKSFEKKIHTFKGNQIEYIFYAIVNYQEKSYDFGRFHLCDQAVLIKFSNGKWLNWVWVEKGFNGCPEINLSFKDLRPELNDEFTKIINVTETKEWVNIKGLVLTNIIYKSFQNAKKELFLSDLIFKFTDKSVTICAIDEPDQNILPNIKNLSFLPNWTIIIFDESMLKEFKRGEYTK